jgi:general secretion pathway protein E
MKHGDMNLSSTTTSAAHSLNTKALKSYFKNLGHLSLYHEFPNFKNILSHGKASIIKLSEAKKYAYVLLELFNNEFIIISLQEEQGSAIWFYLVQQGIKNKYKFAGYYTADASNLKTFAINSVDNKQQKSSDKAKSDNQVFNDIVNNSEPIEWFRSVVAQCIQLKASDIHIEIRAENAALRIRRDGLMRDVGAYDVDTVTQAISAVYTLLAEERSRSEVAFNLNAPQSAVIPLVINGANYGLRYQSHPAVNGYDVIMRVLKTDVRVKNNDNLSLDRLGFTTWQVSTLNETLGTANGGVFVAGITGSGKTTTLSSLLTQLASTGDRKIISIEDPVEYQIPGVSHLSVQRAAGNENSDTNPFAGSMMAFLRMDPDIGMFGEIRDSLSAQIAYTAIQTGHKLLTTVHATSALGIISRLTSSQIGLNRSDICRPEFISALVYQSLIPKNCMHCRVKAETVMDPMSLMVYESIFYLDTSTIYAASDEGCTHCRPENLAPIKGGHAGIDGVTVVAEVIDPDLQLLEYLSNNQDIKAYEYWRNLQNTSFSSPDMLGKPAWGHALYGMSAGLVDPYYFEKIFGSPNKLKVSLNELNHE